MQNICIFFDYPPKITSIFWTPVKILQILSLIGLKFENVPFSTKRLSTCIMTICLFCSKLRVPTTIPLVTIHVKKEWKNFRLPGKKEHGICPLLFHCGAREWCFSLFKKQSHKSNLDIPSDIVRIVFKYRYILFIIINFLHPKGQ